MSRIVFLALSALLVVPLIGGGLAGAGATAEDEKDDFYRYLSVFTEVLRLVRTVYVEDVDLPTMMSGALDGAVDALDPFSVYVPKEQVDEYRRIAPIGRSRSGMMVLKERGVAYVVAVDEGSPAATAGIERGDIVASLEGVSSRDMPIWQIRQVLAGDPGETVEIGVVRQGEAIETELLLGSFPTPLPELEERDGVAVIELANFAPESIEALPELLARAAGKPLILDLRGNAGGEAVHGYQVADLFTEGELGSLLGRDGPVRTFDGEAGAVWSGPLAVLVDRGSQGAAEVLASVLQVREEALTLGESTYGHAGRSSIVRLPSGALLVTTDAFYTGPGGAALDEGIEPDEVIDGIRFATRDEGDAVLGRAVELFLARLAAARVAA